MQTNAIIQARPLGWPKSELLAKLFNGEKTDDVYWDFDIVAKEAPPINKIDEMYGLWRVKNSPLAAVPYTVIPEGLTRGLSIQERRRLYPTAEWWCKLRIYAITVQGITQITITTMRVTAVLNPIYQATFRNSAGEGALADALQEFQRGLGI